MAKEILIQQYNENWKTAWDKFVLQESVNGTFLQTRNFLEYHPEKRFADHSLLFLNGNNIIAVIPAHVRTEIKKQLISHGGSTYGGLIVGAQFCKITYMDMIFQTLERYLQENNFTEIVLKQTGEIYQNSNSALIDYYLFMNGYQDAQEAGFYIDFAEYKDEIIGNFSTSRRRDYRYSLKKEFTFTELVTEPEITEFYRILCNNYEKFGKRPVHTLEELMEFKYSRLPENTKFYGVFLEGEMIAAGMVFLFGKKVFHTQYLAVLQDKTNLFANEFLYTKLIETAKMEGFHKISFGTSTFEGGKVLNRPLAMFKEGFGTKVYVNRTYKKIMQSTMSYE